MTLWWFLYDGMVRYEDEVRPCGWLVGLLVGGGTGLVRVCRSEVWLGFRSVSTGWGWWLDLISSLFFFSFFRSFFYQSRTNLVCLWCDVMGWEACMYSSSARLGSAWLSTVLSRQAKKADWNELDYVLPNLSIYLPGKFIQLEVCAHSFPWIVEVVLRLCE